jgi:hypothetical protein
LAEEHRDRVLKVLQLGSEWTRRLRPAAADRVWLEVALVPSVPAERFVDPAHISGLSDFFKEQSKPAAAPHPVFKVFDGQTPEVLRGRLRLEPRFHSIAMEAYADGSAYIRAEVMEYWLLILLYAAARYADWTGAYGDVDVLAVLVGPDTIVPSTAPVNGQHIFFPEARERADTSPVHATSTLEALASDPAQLQACARRIASDLLADLGYIETTLLKPNSKILSARLDREARKNIELWMRATGLPVDE